MALEAETVIKHSTDKVVKAYASEDFHQHLAKKVGAELKKFEVTGSPEGAFEIVSEQSMPADKLPEIAKKVLKGQVNVTVTDKWQAPAADGSRSSEMKVKVASAPVNVEATQQLQPRGGSETFSVVKGEVNTSIPLIGKKLKSAAEPYLRKFVEVQAREVSAWIEKNG